MKKLTVFTGLFGAIILLWGCPYSSEVALGPAVEKVRTELIGSWKPENQANDETSSYYIITEYDSVRYAVVHFQFDAEAKAYTSKEYVGHSTYLDGFLFMNLVLSGSKEYQLYRFDLTPTGFVLFEVTDNIDEHFDSFAEMQAFFRQNMRASFFYNKDEITLIRK